MAKEEKAYYTVTRRIYLDRAEAAWIDKKMYILNRIYNNGVRYYKKIVDDLRNSFWFNYLYSQMLACSKEEEKEEEKTDEFMSAIIC